MKHVLLYDNLLTGMDKASTAFVLISVVPRRCRERLGFEVERADGLLNKFTPYNHFQVSISNTNTNTIGKIVQNNDML